MSHSVADNDAPQSTPACEHYWAWVSPAGTGRAARICQFCHTPDADWLNHTIEVDQGHGPPCLHCEFADTRVQVRRAEATALRQTMAALIECCEAGQVAYPAPCPWHGRPS